MAAVSVMFSPNYNFDAELDVNLMNVFPVLSSRIINAYKDQNSVPQPLVLGASSNIRIEAISDTNIYNYKGSGLNVYETTVDGQTRTDKKILGVSSTDTSTIIAPEPSASNTVIIKATDLQNTVSVADTTIKKLAGYQHLSTTMVNGFRLANSLDIQGKIGIRDSITTSSDLVVGQNIFGSTMNLVRSITDAGSDLNQVAYGFYINQYNQLELLRYMKYTGGTSAQEKVATFGKATASGVAFSHASNYTVLDIFNGLTSGVGGGSVSGNTGSGSAGSGNSYFNATADGNIYLEPGLYMGIGTANPQYELDVVGTIRTSSVVISPQYLTSSDQRLKENIKIISDVSACLDTVKKLNVYNYNFKMDPNKRERTGFIAQEVKRQLPNAVLQTDFAGLTDCMQIDTDVLIAYLVGAVKALSTKVDQLTAA